MPFENIQIQLIDTPALAPQTIEFWLPAILVRADALLVLIDLGSDPLAQMDAVNAELWNMRIGIGIGKPEEGVVVYQKKALIVGNKIDLPQARQNLAALQNKYGDQLPLIAISAKEKIGLEELGLKVYQMLDIIRVYTKSPSGKPDLNDPIVLKRGSTLEDAAADVHKDFVAKLKYARVWGSGKHDGIMVKRDHLLEDGDVIELHT
jgi:ribosome-interacting GTPase 1